MLFIPHSSSRRVASSTACTATANHQAHLDRPRRPLHFLITCRPPAIHQQQQAGGDEEEEEGIDDERCVSVTDCDCPLGRVAGLVALLKWFSIKSVSCCYSYDYDRYVGEWTISS